MSRGAEDRQRPARTHKYQHVGRPDGERSQHLCVSGMRCDPCIALGHQPVSWTRHAQARKTRAFVVAYSSMLPLMKVEIYETLRSCMGATKTRTFRPRNKSSASFSLRMNFWYVALKYAAFHIGYIDRGGEADITMRTPQFNQGRKISSTGSFSPTPTMCHRRRHHWQLGGHKGYAEHRPSNTLDKLCALFLWATKMTTAVANAPTVPSRVFDR